MTTSGFSKISGKVEKNASQHQNIGQIYTPALPRLMQKRMRVDGVGTSPQVEIQPLLMWGE
jgi:hypothetical protein